MQIITGKHISRRTVLAGMGATVGLPFLDAMVPAGRPWARTEAGAAAAKTRLICIEMSHGSAGSNAWGASQNMWAPAAVGSSNIAYATNPSRIAGALSRARRPNVRKMRSSPPTSGPRGCVSKRATMQAAAASAPRPGATD